MLSLPIPKNAVTVGEIIEEEYRKPLGLTQQQFADALNISRGRYAELVAGKRGVTLDTALRLARVLGTSPQFWINLQTLRDLSEAAKTPASAEIAKLKPIIMASMSSKPDTNDIGLPGARRVASMPHRHASTSIDQATMRRPTKKVAKTATRTLSSGKRK